MLIFTQPRGQTKGPKTFFGQNLFQLLYNHKQKSNAPLRKKNTNELLAKSSSLSYLALIQILKFALQYIAMEGFHVLILLGVALFPWYWKTGKSGCCATPARPPAQTPTTFNQASLPIHFLPSAPPALTHPSHVVRMQAQQTTAPSTMSPSSSPPISSVRDLEVLVAKLYAIVNSQAAAFRDKDTNNPN